MGLSSETQFGTWITQLRAAATLTQEELALRAGYAVPTLKKIERGVTRPSRPMAERLADVLAVPAAERQRFLLLAGATRPAAAAPEPPLQAQPLRPPRSRPAFVAPTVELIGREAALAELLAHLHAPGRRLLTLVGPGGIGKTSLALHAAAELARGAGPGFEDGVVVAALADVGSAGDVVLTIAEAFGQPFRGAQPIADQLLAALADRALLLVLDNVEHLLAPPTGAELSALLGRVLAEAPGVRLLVTSRERLRLRDEWAMELGGLQLPAVDTGPRVERADAVRLFLERARRGGASFTLDAAGRAAVVRICRQLEGMPLAIELAAAWTRTLSPSEIAAELERALDFLTLSDRNAPARHRTLRGTLDYSWDLLDHAERTTLARLSVFSGGCEREAAASITGATLPVLTALIDKSLVRRADVDGVTRYTLHELVRQYAAERLQADPDDEAAASARHTAYYAGLLQSTIDPRTAASTPAGLATVERNLDNLRAAWVRAGARGDGAAIGAMIRGFWIVYDRHGWLLDGAALFGQAAAALRAAGPRCAAVRGHVLGLQAYFLHRANRYPAALPVLEEGFALLDAAGASERRNELLYVRALIEVHLGHVDAARAGFSEAAALARADDDTFRRLWCELWLGAIAMITGDYTLAEQRYTDFYAGWQGRNYQRGEAIALATLGEIRRLTGRPAAALATLHDGLQIGGTARDTLAIGMCLGQLGALALERDEWDEARYLLTESVEIMHEIGDAWHAGRSLSLLVRVELARGAGRSAQAACAELVQIVADGETILLVDAAYGLALLLQREGSYGEALALLLAVEGCVGEFATVRASSELRTALQRRLDAPARAAAVALGRGRVVLPWLAELARRSFGPAVVDPAPTPAPAPAAAAGVFVPETGETLSPREVEVLRLIIAGASNQALADTLVISVYTAKHHVASILGKLGVATRTQAALRGRSLGLEPPSSQ